EGGERRDRTEADESPPRDEDPRDHHAPRADLVDEEAGEEAEERSHHELAVGIAGRDLLARPAEVPDEEVVEEREPVEGEPDDREEREEARDDGEDLPAPDVARADVVHARSVSFTWRSRSASGCFV